MIFLVLYIIQRCLDESNVSLLYGRFAGQLEMNASQGEEFHCVSQRCSSTELSRTVGALDDPHRCEASEKKKKLLE